MNLYNNKLWTADHSNTTQKSFGNTHNALGTYLIMRMYTLFRYDCRYKKSTVILIGRHIENINRISHKLPILDELSLFIGGGQFNFYKKYL